MGTLDGAGRERIVNGCFDAGELGRGGTLTARAFPPGAGLRECNSGRAASARFFVAARSNRESGDALFSASNRNLQEETERTEKRLVLIWPTELTEEHGRIFDHGFHRFDLDKTNTQDDRWFGSKSPGSRCSGSDSVSV